MLERWRRHLQRHHDAGSASMASYVVAAALFIVGSSYLVHFIIEPPGAGVANLQHAALKAQAGNALEVLLGSPGVPSTWSATSEGIDDAFRIGLIESGTTIRVDPAKFDALARGKLETSSGGNGAVDYAEIKDKLGLDGYDFHLRAYPLISPSEAAPYGVSGYDDFEVAYVGHFDEGVYSEEAKREAHALESLDIPFTNTTREADENDGDVYMDDSGDIRDNLLPNIGNAIEQTIISSGSGTKYSFYRVNASTYEDLISGTPGLTGSAMALSEEGGQVLGYNKNRELRTILGSVDMRLGVASLSWSEWVDSDRGNLTYDCGDYGYVEVSIDDGETWERFDDAELRSRDCTDLTTSPPTTPLGAAMDTRALNIHTLCAACVGEANVLVAFHWVSDNDNNIGYGWVVDDVLVTGASGTLLWKTFEAPAYSMLIIGSSVEHQAFTPEDVKDAIRDYIDLYGGRILIVGGTDNENWLLRLFEVGIESSGGGISTPDVTHPILTLPNELDYGGYEANGAWDFSGSDDAELFHMVASGENPDDHVLSVSQQGAWGESATAEGAVILTTYLPWKLGQEEMRRFFANNVVYGRYHYLYLEVGPVVPEGEAVASATRTATMNMYRDGDENYTEMAFIMYVWPGSSIDGTYEATAIDPTPPRNLVATAGSASVTLTWAPPASNGTGVAMTYHVFRGHSSTTITELAGTVPYVIGATSATFTDDGGPTIDTPVNGVTYYYNVTLTADHEGTRDPNIPVHVTDDTHGTPSDPASATPIGQPGAPAFQTPEATGELAHIRVKWNLPASTGGGTIFGYALYANATNELDGAYWKVGEVGNVTEYLFPTNSTSSYAFKVQALNAWGWSDVSARSAGYESLAFATAPTLTVTNATAHQTLLTWAAPSDLGSGSLSGYNVWRNITGSSEFHLLTYINSAANLSHIDANVTDNTTYVYKLQAVTSAGDGLNSTEKTLMTLGAPWRTRSVVWQSGDLILGYVTLGWTAPYQDGGSPVLTYEIYRGATQGTESYLGTSVTTSYLDLTAGASTWWYKVRAVNAVGNGEFSDATRMSKSGPV